MGAGGDLEYIATLSDRDFVRTTQSIDRVGRASIEKHKQWNNELAKGVQKGFGNWEKAGRAAWLGVAASIPLAIKAVKEYAEINSYAKQEVDGLDRSITKMWQSFGRGASSGGISILSSTVDWATATFDHIATGLATIGKTGQKISGGTGLRESWLTATSEVLGGDEEKRRTEQLDREARDKQSLREVSLQLDLNRANRTGNALESRRIETLMMRERLLSSIGTVEHSPEKDALLARIRSEPLPSQGVIGLRPGMGTAYGLAFNARGGLRDVLPSRGDNFSDAINSAMQIRSRTLSTGRGGPATHVRYGPTGGEMIYANDEDIPSASRGGGEIPLLQKHFEQNQRIIDILDKIDKNTKDGAARFK